MSLDDMKRKLRDLETHLGILETSYYLSDRDLRKKDDLEHEIERLKDRIDLEERQIPLLGEIE